MLFKCYGCKTHKPESEFYPTSRKRKADPKPLKNGKVRPLKPMRPVDGYCIECNKKKRRTWAEPSYYERHKVRILAKARRNRYGLEPNQVQALYDEQGGKCAICCAYGVSALQGKKKAMSVDHCHRTGVIRGMLCNFCNQGLGCLKDDPALLRAAAAYLERLPPELVAPELAVELAP